MAECHSDKATSAGSDIMSRPAAEKGASALASYALNTYGKVEWSGVEWRGVEWRGAERVAVSLNKRRERTLQSD
jgi:hypothetical protein